MKAMAEALPRGERILCQLIIDMQILCLAGCRKTTVSPAKTFRNR